MEQQKLKYYKNLAKEKKKNEMQEEIFMNKALKEKVNVEKRHVQF